MQSEVWKSLLGRIPVELHNILMVKTSAGTEINIQDVLRVEPNFVVLRGRLAGSTDMGKIFFLPYNRLDHIGFQKPVSDTQIYALLDGTAASPAPTTDAATASSIPLPPPQGCQEPARPTPSPGSEPAPPAATLSALASNLPSAGNITPGLLTRLPTKSKILQRLRLQHRGNEGGKAQKQ
jgi:hypothetical protein